MHNPCRIRPNPAKIQAKSSLARRLRFDSVLKSLIFFAIVTALSVDLKSARQNQKKR
jgi:hypothetical protein